MNVTPAVHEKVKTLLAQRQKINAVKLVHDTTGCSLKEAKDYVDHVERTQHRAGMPAPDAGNIDLQLKALLDQGDRLRAIKLYKEYSGADLATSKDYVDLLEQRVVVSGRQPPQPAVRPHVSTQIDQAMRQHSGAVRTNQGGGRVVLFIVVLILVAVIAWALLRQH